MRWIWVGLGGGLGSVLRFYLQGRIQAAFPTFPWGTLAVNLLGSAAIGFLAGFFEIRTAPLNTRLFLMAGILGGFTTFSAFSLDNLNLLRAGQTRFMLMNVALSNVLGIGLAVAAYFFSKALLKSLNLHHF